jgi:TRAP-type C4-dicarboxylate transport system substrate-binding protein
MQAAKDSMPFQIKLWKEFEKVSEEKVTAAGSVITHLTPEAVAEFQKAMEPLYSELKPELQAVVKKIQEVK